MAFPENLKQLRTKKKFTTAKLAEKIGVSHQMITKYETGKSKPTYENLIKLAKALGVTIDKLCK